MDINNNTIVITGGSSGIGLALAESFIAAGNKVLICGRREAKLQEAKEKLPQLHTRVCDVSNEEDRRELFHWATTEFPDINMLINNAGIQKEVDFTTGADGLLQESEIDINMTGTIHLSALFTPYFLKQNKKSAIVNVTSGLAFIPLKIVPVYCTTKAGLHAFTMSLRSQLKGTNVHVFEVAPPNVKTELHREERARKQSEKRGIMPQKVANQALKGIKNNKYEIIIGEAKQLKGASRIAPNFFHKLLNNLAGG